VLEEAAIRVLPARLATGSRDKHYRLDWEEQKKAGKPLVDDIVKLPTRPSEVKP
jgi:ferredoxin-type protein NapG